MRFYFYHLSTFSGHRFCCLFLFTSSILFRTQCYLSVYTRQIILLTYRHIVTYNFLCSSISIEDSPVPQGIPDVAMGTPPASHTPNTSPMKPQNYPNPLRDTPMSPGGQVIRVKESEGGPYPREVSREELTVLEGCLRRWRKEVEADVKGKEYAVNP